MVTHGYSMRRSRCVTRRFLPPREVSRYRRKLPHADGGFPQTDWGVQSGSWKRLGKGLGADAEAASCGRNRSQGRRELFAAADEGAGSCG